MTAETETSRIAGRFLDARRSAGSLDAYPGAMPTTLEEAYAIQDEAIARWQRPVIGWKVGRVPPPFWSVLLFKTASLLERVTRPCL